MRRTNLLLAGLVLAVSLGSDSANDYGDKTEVVGIEGTWRQVEEEFRGHTKKPERHWLLTIRGETYTEDDGQGTKVFWRCRVDNTRKTPHLDLLSSSGSVSQKGIYQVDGNRLRIAFYLVEIDDKERRRPTTFGGENVIIATYKRVK